MSQGQVALCAVCCDGDISESSCSLLLTKHCRWVHMRGGDWSRHLYQEVFFGFRIRVRDTFSSVDWRFSRSVTTCSRQRNDEVKGQPDTRHERQNSEWRY